MNSMPSFNTTSQAASQVESATFREAMARLGAAVNIITTDGPAGRAGFAASAVCSVTDTPPTLLVCLNRSSSVFPAFETNQSVCVNTLRAGHENLSALFGGKTPAEERFAAAEWIEGASGAPMLKDAVVAFDCVVSNCMDIGTHRVLFCSVLDVHQGDDAEALIYFRRAYHHVGTLAPDLAGG